MYHWRHEVAGRYRRLAVMPSAFLALFASLAFGSSDFLAGLVSRRISSVTVALWSQIAGAAALVAALAASGQRPDGSGILWGAVAGVTVASGVLSLYRALAIGPASLAAPVSASGVALPVLVGILGGNRVSPVVALGLTAAVGGLALASFAGGRDAEDVEVSVPGPLPLTDARPGLGDDRRMLPFALLSALCFGSFFVLLDRGTAGAEGATLWVALGVYAGALPTSFAVGVFSRRSGGLRLPSVRLLVPVALVGLLAVGGDVSLTYATATGQIAVVSVLASLDTLVTVLLARFVLAERLPRLQSIGVGLSLAGVILVSSG